MGGCSTKDYSMPSFDPNCYLRPGLTKQEVNGIYLLFCNLHPNQDGLVQVRHIQELYKDSFEKNLMDMKFENKDFINFNEFFEIMYENIMDKKDRFNNIEFEGNMEQVTCLVCPYVEQSKN